MLAFQLPVLKGIEQLSEWGRAVVLGTSARCASHHACSNMGKPSSVHRPASPQGTFVVVDLIPFTQSRPRSIFFLYHLFGPPLGLLSRMWIFTFKHSPFKAILFFPSLLISPAHQWCTPTCLLVHLDLSPHPLPPVFTLLTYPSKNHFLSSL